MIALPTGTRVWLAAGVTVMRKGVSNSAGSRIRFSALMYSRGSNRPVSPILRSFD